MSHARLFIIDKSNAKQQTGNALNYPAFNLSTLYSIAVIVFFKRTKCNIVYAKNSFTNGIKTSKKSLCILYGYSMVQWFS